MSKFLTLLLAVMTFAACTNTNEKMSKCENVKLKLSFSAEQAPGATNKWLVPVSEEQYKSLGE